MSGTRCVSARAHSLLQCRPCTLLYASGAKCLPPTVTPPARVPFLSSSGSQEQYRGELEAVLLLSSELKGADMQRALLEVKVSVWVACNACALQCAACRTMKTRYTNNPCHAQPLGQHNTQHEGRWCEQVTRCRSTDDRLMIPTMHVHRCM